MYTTCQYQESILDLCQCPWWSSPGPRWCFLGTRRDVHIGSRVYSLCLPTWDEIKVSIVIVCLIVESIRTVTPLSTVKDEDWRVLEISWMVENPNQNWLTILLIKDRNHVGRRTRHTQRILMIKDRIMWGDAHDIHRDKKCVHHPNSCCGHSKFKKIH